MHVCEGEGSTLYTYNIIMTREGRGHVYERGTSSKQWPLFIEKIKCQDASIFK